MFLEFNFLDEAYRYNNQVTPITNHESQIPPRVFLRTPEQSLQHFVRASCQEGTHTQLKVNGIHFGSYLNSVMPLQVLN